MNPVIKKLVSNSDIFIPFTLKKNVIPIFHLENIDWFEDTLYGKSTSHLLQISVSLPCINEECETIVLDLENAQSLTLINNPFDQLLNCETPKDT